MKIIGPILAVISLIMLLIALGGLSLAVYDLIKMMILDRKRNSK